MNAKKRITLSSAVLLVLTSSCLAAGPGQIEYDYITVNVGPYNPPGSQWFGINNSGALVGNTGWPGPAPAGTTPPEIGVATILDKGNLTTWSATLPDGSTSGWSEFMEVNEHGVIVGDYWDDSLPIAYDFVRSPDGHITLLPPVPVPGGAPSYFVAENIGINNEGTIVGTFTLDPNWTSDYPAAAWHGFIFKDGKYTTWDYQGASSTWFDSINDNGTIGGAWRDAAGNGHAFLLNKDGTTTSIVPPASLSPAEPAYSFVNGLNNKGDVVGVYRYYDVTTATTFSRGFLLSDGIYSQIYLPNDAGDTWALNINDEGVIDGTYGNFSNGFIATPVH